MRHHHCTAALPAKFSSAQQASKARRIAGARHGDEHKPVYITEAGWNDHPRWTASVSPSQRIRYTIDAYEWAQQHWPWSPVVVMWTFRLPAPRFNYRDNYAFVTTEFEPKPVYLEVQRYAQDD